MDKSTQYKIFSDPVHGFITIPKGIVLRLIDHPFVQRLRRIRQLGLGYLVFPAAEHSRFSHAIGAMELGQRVLKILREKDTTLSDAEVRGTLIAILLHDIGHGPLSHTLEHTLIKDFNHEMMSLKIMESLNEEFDGELDTAISIFKNLYPKKFLNQLISSQLDMDRLDYLKRDSFFTGVSEGSVGINRILKTMRVFKGNVVIEKKGIYAVENYILSRRLMYMQVYLHKTVLSADVLLRKIFERTQFLIENGESVPVISEPLSYFITRKPSSKKIISDEMMNQYLSLDDNDIFITIKGWRNHPDRILSDLSDRFLNRRLFRTSFSGRKERDQNRKKVHTKTKNYLKKQGFPHDDVSVQFYYEANESYSEAYKYENESIWILEDGKNAIEFSKAADTKHIIALTKPVVKPYLVHLKEIQA
jgi:HD superfamily phosphohydrolase